jgi:Fe-S-cluster containining protein
MRRDELKERFYQGVHPWDDGPMNPLPFEPQRPATFFIGGDSQEPDSTYWQCSCPWLDDDGRCQYYDERPQVCREYTPGRDPMCAEFKDDWATYAVPYEESDDEEGM